MPENLKRPRVQVLTFDRLWTGPDVRDERRSGEAVADTESPDSCELSAERAADTEWKCRALLPSTLRDELDLSAVCFEQFLLQDVRDEASWSDVFGGDAAALSFADACREAGLRICGVTLTFSGSEAEPGRTKATLPDNLFSEVLHVPLSLSGREQQAELEAARIQVDRRGFLSAAECVWWHVELPPSNSADAVAAVLRTFPEISAMPARDSGESPILLVTTLRGEGIRPAPPFESLCDNSRMHVPFWVSDGVRHARRIQQIVGSFDLLPTLSDILTGWSDEHSSDQRTDLSVGVPGNLSMKPLSLTGILRSFRDDRERVLPIEGGTWIGVRSHQYLLVREKHTRLPDSDSDVDSSVSPPVNAERRRFLFLKPDDLWNIYDAAVPYESIADILESFVTENRNAPHQS